MKRIITFFVERTFVVNIIAAFVVLAGILAVSSMKRDLHPPFEWNQVQVVVTLIGAAPTEIEKFITYPVEEALDGLAGVDYIGSTSRNGNAQINLHYRSGFDRMDQAAEDVRSRIEGIRSKLPQNVRSIQVTRFKTDNLFLYWLGIANFDQYNLDHRIFVKKMEQRLGDIEGVVKVENRITARDVYIAFDLNKLKKFEISADQAKRAIRSSLKFAPIGLLDRGDEKLTIEMTSTTDSIEKIREIPLRGNRMGNIVKLKEVAEVNFKLARLKGMDFVNGKPAISMVLRKDLISDSIDLKKVVDREIKKINSMAPDNLEVVALIDGPQFIKRQLDVLSKNGMVGFLLVVLILMLFLNWRVSLMTSLGLPVAYFGAFIVLHAMGIDFDLLSIIGMILVIGILVDDAIIVSERYSEHLEKGKLPRDAAVAAVRDLIVPVTGTVLTTIVAFAPLVLIQSEMSTILKAVPVVVITALILSYIESFFILPNHLAHFVKSVPKEKGQGFFLKVRKVYEVALRKVIHYRYVFVALLLIFCGGVGYLGATKLKNEFRLNISSEKVVVFATLKESNSFMETRLAIDAIEKMLSQFPKDEVDSVFTSVGEVWMNGRMQESPRFAKIRAHLNPNHPHPTDLKRRIKKKIETYVSGIKDDRFEKLDVEIERQGDKNKKVGLVSVRVRGDDDVDYHEIEKAVIASAKTVEQIKEFVPNKDLYQKSWRFVPDNSALIQYQLTPQDVASQVRGVFMPDEIEEVRLGGEKTVVYAEFKKKGELDHSQLGDFELVTAKGSSVPMKFMGRWEEVNSLKQIAHHKGRRSLIMDFKLKDEGTNAGKAIENLGLALGSVQKKFPTYEIEAIDADEQEAKSRAWAFKVALVCIVGVLFVIALILGSLTQPFLVGLPIPFALVGIVLALLAHQAPMGLMALIGMLGTVGVCVNASIIMVDQMNRMAKERGHSLNREIIILGASSRLRAIVLTTMTTLGGVFPMAYALGGESGFTQPLAFSMAWGLSFATLMTLFFLPASLQIKNDIAKPIKKIATKLKGKRKPAQPPQEREAVIFH